MILGFGTILHDLGLLHTLCGSHSQDGTCSSLGWPANYFTICCQPHVTHQPSSWPWTLTGRPLRRQWIKVLVVEQVFSSFQDASCWPGRWDYNRKNTMTVSVILFFWPQTFHSHCREHSCPFAKLRKEIMRNRWQPWKHHGISSLSNWLLSKMMPWACAKEI